MNRSPSKSRIYPPSPREPKTRTSAKRNCWWLVRMFTLCNKAPGTIDTRDRTGWIPDLEGEVRHERPSHFHLRSKYGRSCSWSTRARNRPSPRRPCASGSDGVCSLPCLEQWHPRTRCHAWSSRGQSPRWRSWCCEAEIVERVQESMTGKVSGGCATVGLASLSVCPPSSWFFPSGVRENGTP